MPNAVGPVVGYSRMRAEYTQVDGPAYSTINVWFYLDMVGGGSSNGTWPASWDGYWGRGSNNIYRNIPTNGSSLVVQGSYQVPRGASDYNAIFAAAAQNYWGTPELTIWLLIPKKQSVPAAPQMLSSTPDQITDRSMRVQFSSKGDGGSPVTKWELQYSTTSNMSGAKTVSSSGTSVISGLAAKTTYYFRARGINAIGTGPYSSIKSGATLGVPGAPALKTTAVETRRIALSVTGPSYTGGSILERQTQRSTSKSFTTVTTSASTSPNFTGLTRVTTYYFRSRARNSYGWGPWSSTLTVSTIGEPPGAPADYSVGDIASTTAYADMPSVSDNGGGSIVSVRAQINTSASATGATTITESAFQAVFIYGRTPGTTYYARLSVMNSVAGGGWGPWGPWVSFTMRDDVPTPPRSFTAVTTGNTTARVQWLAPADLLGSDHWGYTLRLSTSSSFSEGLEIISPEVEDVERLLDGLQPGTRYYVQLQAISSNGPGSWTNPVSFLTTGTAPVQRAAWQRVNGAWRSGSMWLRVSGVWKRVTIYQRVNGVWRRG